MLLRKIKSALGVALLAALGSLQLSATPVPLELSLLVDTSGSIDNAEFLLQRNGYKNAFNNSTVINAIIALGGIAVNYVEWSGAGEFVELLPFQFISTEAQIRAFGNAIGNLSGRTFTGQTAPGDALSFARGKFNNGFEGTRLVIDISGDGVQNAGSDTLTQANATKAAGITINGLVILGADAGVSTFYQNNIVTPGGGTLFTANDFASFESALITKLGAEVSGTTGGTPGGEIPEPSTYAMLGTGLALAVASRVRRKA